MNGKMNKIHAVAVIFTLVSRFIYSSTSRQRSILTTHRKLHMDTENFTQKSTLIVTLHKVEHVTGMSEQGCKYLDSVYEEFMILGLWNDQHQNVSNS